MVWNRLTIIREDLRSAIAHLRAMLVSLVENHVTNPDIV